MPPAEEPTLPGWERLYDEAPCGLLLTDADGTIRHVNRTFCRWIGFECDALIGARRFQDLLTMGGKIFHQTHWSPLLHMQGSVAEVKLDIVHRDGRSLPMVLNAVRREHEGRTVHELAVFVAEDRHTYERELMRARKEAAQQHAAAADRAVFAEQMVGIVSHDLRNPLSAITLGSGLLTRADLQPPFDRALGHITAASKRAQTMVDDLLDFTQARIGRGLNVNRRAMELHAVVARYVDELRIAYPGRALVHLVAGDGECVGDDHRICQLIGNLVSNAVTYGAPDAPITIATEIADGAAAVRVHNFGRPIPADLLPTLFQPMVRGGEVALGGRSVGLGLYIVSEIARAHGGSIEAHSNEADGTTFVFHFPL